MFNISILLFIKKVYNIARFTKEEGYNVYAQINNYNLAIAKENEKNIRIIMFSDIHFAEKYKLIKLKNIIKYANNNNPDYICIPGDILDDSDVVKNHENRNILLAWLKELSDVAKIIISVGNHDIMHIVDSEWQFQVNDEWFKDLSEISNVVLLQNSIYEDKNIRFIGFNPSFSYYEKEKENEITFLIELNTTFNKIIKNDLLNIMLCHTPTNILNDLIIDNSPCLKNIDVILSGHIHGGLVPPLIDALWKCNKGFISPTGQLVPNLARGIMYKDGKVCIVSTGITKLGYSTGLLEKLNSLFPMNINNIEINSAEKIKRLQ